MSSKMIIAIVYFVIMAIVNFCIYAKLCNYMYMAAGVKKEDVRKYLSEQHSSNAQRRLVRWLRERADDSKEFNKMYFYCSATSFFAAITGILIVVIVVSRLNFDIVKIIMVFEAVATVLLAIFGFMEGKKVKEQMEFYFESSAYKPYESEDLPFEIDDLDELYKDSDETSDDTYTKVDSDEKEKKEKKRKILRYAIKIIVVIIALMFLLSPIIFKNVRFNFIHNNYNENSYGQNEYAQEEIPKDVNITLVRNKLEESSFAITGSIEEREKEYPNYLFEDTFCVNENEMYVEYLKMVNNEDAINLYHNLKDELVEKFSKDKENDIVTKDNKKNVALYAIETNDGYAIVIRDKSSVIYAHCDEVQKTWLKNFMYELGYLETF